MPTEVAAVAAAGHTLCVDIVQLPYDRGVVTMTEQSQISRRSVAKGIAWAAPVVMAAGLAPAFAASNAPLASIFWKCNAGWSETDEDVGKKLSWVEIDFQLDFARTNDVVVVFGPVTGGELVSGGAPTWETSPESWTFEPGETQRRVVLRPGALIHGPAAPGHENTTLTFGYSVDGVQQSPLVVPLAPHIECP